MRVIRDLWRTRVHFCAARAHLYAADRNVAAHTLPIHFYQYHKIRGIVRSGRLAQSYDDGAQFRGVINVVAANV